MQELLVSREIRVSKANQVSLDHRGLQDSLVRQAEMARPVPRQSRVRMGYQVLRVPRVLLALLALQA